ncbi:hypothetical protein D9M72_520700 [compost metagenome]
MGRLDDGAVTGDASRRGQRIHLLGARKCARQAVDGEDRGLPGGELLHQLGVLRRPDEVDQCAALAHQAHFLGAGRAHLEDNVRGGPQRRGIRQHFGPGGAIGFVAEVGGLARARFDGDRKAQLDEFFHHVGHGGYTFFAGESFAGDADALGVTALRCQAWVCLHERSSPDIW